MSELLEKARSYEAKKIAATDKESKPLFHISAPAGWINDPNGFSVYNGKIHLFYQYYPYLREWGPMHWGHSTTSDMIKWEQLPCVMAPDEEYDKKGCFSGSAIEADGKHVLVYTGVTSIKLPDGSEQERQNQCIAFGDGLNYVKHENNPVVTGDMLPENCSRIDFRDPKIWKEDDTYYLIVGSKDLNNVGQVVLCSSKNLTDWQFETILAANSTGKIGTMWECPDFFGLEDKHVLICSPQSMKADKYEFHNGHNSVYFLGDYDKENHVFIKEEPHTLDYGMDFYAPQTTLLPDGRRVMIAWMKSWDACVVPDSQDWQGMMTLPRELEIKDGRIWQKPVKEIENYRANKCHYTDKKIDCYTTFLNGFNDQTDDIVISKKICNDLGQKHTIFKEENAPKEYEEKIQEYCGKYQFKRTMDSAYRFLSVFPNHAIVDSDILDQIGKGNNIPSSFVTAYYLSCKLHSKSKYTKMAFKEYLKSCKKESLDKFSLYAWEMRIGRWAAQTNMLYALGGLPNLNIFNSREIILLWLNIPNKQRREHIIHSYYLKQNAPNLMPYPYNPSEKYSLIRSKWYLYYFATIIRNIIS